LTNPRTKKKAVHRVAFNNNILLPYLGHRPFT